MTTIKTQVPSDAQRAAVTNPVVTKLIAIVPHANDATGTFVVLFGVQVVTDDGGDVSGRRAIGRTLAFPLSFLILCLGFLGILLGDQRRALHDIIAGTVVIYCWDARAARLRLLSRPRYSTPRAPPESHSLPGSPGQADPPC